RPGASAGRPSAQRGAARAKSLSAENKGASPRSKKVAQAIPLERPAPRHSLRTRGERPRPLTRVQKSTTATSSDGVRHRTRPWAAEGANQESRAQAFPPP